MPITLEKV